jgi:hypothetical protein
MATTFIRKIFLRSFAGMTARQNETSITEEVGTVGRVPTRTAQARLRLRECASQFLVLHA